MARTSLNDFVTNYEVKNGYVGSQEVLNKPPHQLKLEINELWNYVAGGIDTDTLPSSGINDFLINDAAYSQIPTTQRPTSTRSTQWIQTNILSTTAAEARSNPERTVNGPTIWAIVQGISDAGDTIYNGGTF